MQLSLFTVQFLPQIMVTEWKITFLIQSSFSVGCENAHLTIDRWVEGSYGIVEFNIFIFLIKIRIVVNFYVYLEGDFLRIRFGNFGRSSTNYGRPNEARTVGNNVVISLTLVAFGSGVGFGEIPFGGFTSIVSFTAFALEISLTWRGMGTRIMRLCRWWRFRHKRSWCRSSGGWIGD